MNVVEGIRNGRGFEGAVTQSCPLYAPFLPRPIRTSLEAMSKLIIFPSEVKKFPPWAVLCKSTTWSPLLRCTYSDCVDLVSHVEYEGVHNISEGVPFGNGPYSGPSVYC